MKNKRINTEEELSAALGVKSINDIKEDNIGKLVAMLSDINPDLIDKVIAAIPVSVEALGQLIKAVSQLYDENKVEVVVGDKETLKAYKEILDIVKRESQRPDLSFEELKKYIDEMKSIAKSISEEERRKEDFEKELRDQKTSLILSLVIGFFIVVVIIAICILIPGVLLEILVATLGIIGIVIIVIVNANKRKMIKQKYKNMK